MLIDKPFFRALTITMVLKYMFNKKNIEFYFISAVARLLIQESRWTKIMF